MSFNRAHKQETSLDFYFKFKAQIQAQKDEGKHNKHVNNIGFKRL